MSDRNAAIGIDVGSTNVKVAVVAADGTILGSAGAPIETRRRGDVATQDAELLWGTVVETIRAAMVGVPAAAIGQIGCCSQYSSIVAVDPHGLPLSDVIMWFDKRGTERCWALLAEHEEAFELWVERHGIPPVGNGLSLAHILHLQDEEPAIHERTAAYLEVMDYVNGRLTGVLAANQCSTFTVQLCDNRGLGVTTYDDDLIRLAGVDRTKLPDLRLVSEPVGEVVAAVAADLGLAAGVQVQAGINDSQMGALATGAADPFRLGAMIGTTSVLLDTVDHHAVDLDHEVLAMPGPLGDSYIVWAENGIGGKAVEHVLAGLVHQSDALGDHAIADPFADLEAALAGSPAGRPGVLFLPWLSGSLSPDSDPSMRGGFVNLSLDDRRVDLVRAAVEGVCHNLAWLLPFVGGFSGHQPSSIVFGGGAARSAGWAQTLADICELEVHTLSDAPWVVSRMAGLLALHRAGVLQAEDLTDRVSTDQVFEPTESLREHYAVRQQQFEAAFAALRPIHAALGVGASS